MKWYKRDPDAALVGMIGLSLEERAIYNTVIDLLYSRDGDLPTDDQFFARACGCRPQVWRRVRDSLIAKDKLHWLPGGKLTANRVEKELKTARKLMANRVENSEKTDSKLEIETPVSDKNDNAFNDALVNSANEDMAVHAREQPQPHPNPHPEKKESRAVAEATRPKLAVDRFDEFWSAYPKRDGANPKEPSRKKFTGAIKSGVDPGEIIAGARAYANAESDKIGTPYIAQAKTWLNEKRWKDYAPRAPTEPEAPTAPPGAPTHEELMRKYADRGQTEETPGTRTKLLAGGSEARRTGPNRMVLDRQDHGGIPSLGAVFCRSGLEAVCHQADREERDHWHDNADTVA